MGLLGNGEGHTLLILTDAESRLMREALACHHAEHRIGPDGQKAAASYAAFNDGIQRGTAKLQEEFAALQKAKRR